MSLEKIKAIFLEEANEHLEILQKIILNLDNIQIDTEQRQEAHRSLFCLRGGFGMLGYPFPIVAYGLDDCFQLLVLYPKMIDSKISHAFTELVTLLKQAVEAIDSGISPDSNEWSTLARCGSDIIERLKLELNNVSC